MNLKNAHFLFYCISKTLDERISGGIKVYCKSNSYSSSIYFANEVRKRVYCTGDIFGIQPCFLLLQRISKESFA